MNGLHPRERGILQAIGEVLSVEHEPGIAVFLVVALRHYFTDNGQQAGEPLQAVVRWAPAYHGLDEDGAFGDWHFPKVGSDVLCFFPGVAADGNVGDDLENGYAVAYASNLVEPPVEVGIAGDLGHERRVHRGQKDVDYDLRLRRNLDYQIDQNETGTVVGSRVNTVEGTETEVVGGDVEITHESNETYLVEGDESHTVQGDEERETEGVFSWLWNQAATLTSLVSILMTAISTTVEGETLLDLKSDTKIRIRVGSTEILVESGGITITGNIAQTGDALVGDGGEVDLGGLGGLAVARGGYPSTTTGDTYLSSPNRIYGGSSKVRAVGPSVAP